MPAKAGIQSLLELPRLLKPWIPACAGMTGFFRSSLGGLALQATPPAFHTRSMILDVGMGFFRRLTGIGVDPIVDANLVFCFEQGFARLQGSRGVV